MSFSRNFFSSIGLLLLVVVGSITPTQLAFCSVEDHLHRVVDLAKMAVDFEENNFKIMEPIYEADCKSGKISENSKNMNLKILKLNTEQIAEIYSLLKEDADKIIAKQTSVATGLDAMLSGVLFVRKNYLEQRLANYREHERKKMMAGGGKFESDFIATYPLAAKWLTKAIDSEAPFFLIARTATDRYQLFNALIRELLDAVSIDELSEETKRLLQCSISIHQFLNHESDDSGHADMAVYCEAGANRKIVDVDLFAVHINQNNTGANQSLGVAKSWPTKGLTALQRLQAKIKAQEEAALQRLPDLKEVMSYHYKKLAGAKEQVCSGSKVGKLAEEKNSKHRKQKKGKEKSLVLSADEQQMENLLSEKLSLSAVSFEQPPMTCVDQVSLMAEDVDRGSSDHTPDGSEGRTSDRSDEEDGDGCLEKNESCSKQATGSASVRVKQPVELAEAFAGEKLESPRPRGMRLFHNKQAESFIAEPSNTVNSLLTKLKQEDRNFINALFDGSAHVVKFSDFERVWLRINGVGSITHNASGGSHLRLLNSKGEVVAGIFAHGKNQQYAIGYQKYLIDAFRSVGITRELLINYPR